MPAATPQGALARRRTPARPGYGVELTLQPPPSADVLVVSVDPRPWAAHEHRNEYVFRGRLAPGTATLAARSSSRGSRGITVGLASRPIVLRSAGVAHPIAAGIPWVVQSDTEWRVSCTEPTDLRLAHSDGFANNLVDKALDANRPTRFEGRTGQIVRTALRSATPAWIDAAHQQVEDLAEADHHAWTLLDGPSPTRRFDHDTFHAFVLLLTWALEQRCNAEDPRLTAIKQFIKARLADPTLNTETIAEQLRISRRTLQTLLEPEGGVAVYLRRLRLAAVLQLITRDPDLLPDLDAVAEITGLGSRRTLERAMRQVYGLTPRQARAQVLAGHQLRERHLDELRAS